MKKTFLLLSSLIIALVFVSCGGNGDKAKETAQLSTEKLESVSVGSEKIYLRYKFEKGDEIKYRLTTISNSEESIVADTTMKQKMDQTVSYVFTGQVLEVDEDKVAEISMTITSIKFDANANGEKIKFDSDKQPSKDELVKFIEYASVINTPFRARVTSKGEILEVSRLEKMIDKMNSLSPQKQNLSIEQKSALAKQMGESGIKPITQMLFREMPANVVAKDSSWDRKYSQAMGPLNVENVVKFKIMDFVKVNDSRAANVSANLSATFSGKRTGTENGINFAFGEPKVSGTGTIIFDFDEGRLVKANTGTQMEFSVTMEAKDSLQKVKKSKRTTLSSSRNIVEML